MSDEEKNTQKDIQDEEAVKCEKCEEYIAGWKRALADYDNLKKDLMRERMEIRRGAREELAQQLIVVLDNFDHASRFKPEGLSDKVEGWLKGFMHVKNQLEGLMRDLGLEPFGEAGETFDAHVHEAVGEQHDENKADHVIIEVPQRGWKMSDRVVRPAKVIINNKER